MKPREDNLATFKVWLSGKGAGEVPTSRIELAEETLSDFAQARPLQHPNTENHGGVLVALWWGDLYVYDFTDYRLVYSAK